jgi:hypothetical protein
VRWGLAAWVVGRSIIRDRNPDTLVKSVWRQSLTDCRAVRHGKNQTTLAHVFLDRRGIHRDPAFSFSAARSREHHPDFVAVLLTTCPHKILGVEPLQVLLLNRRFICRSITFMNLVLCFADMFLDHYAPVRSDPLFLEIVHPLS